MTTKTDKAMLLLLPLCLTLSVSAAPEAEYGKLARTWTLHSDGSQEFRHEMELTLFTHTAMNETYGESFIIYDPQYQKLRINAAYTRQKDGTIIQTPANAFVEVLPQEAADAPAYNRLKEMVVVHTGLEPGATICLDYTLTSEAGYLPEVDVFEELLQSSPVKEYTLRIVTPETKPLAYTLAGNDTEPSVREADGLRTTTWTLRNLPAASRAPFVSVSNGDVPFLAATTYTSEEAALNTLFKQFNASGNLQLQAIAEGLTEEKEGDAEKLEALLSYVTDGLDDNPLSLEQTGYRFRKAEEVIRSAYGTTAEKTNILTGLLNGAGYQAEPVAAYRASIAQGAALKAIGQLYVKCVAGGETYLFSVHSRMHPQTAKSDRTPLFSLATGKRAALAIPDDYRIEGEMIFTCQDTAAQVVKRITVGQNLLPYFANGKTESDETMPLAAKEGYVRLLLPDAAQGMAYRPYGHLNSGRTENLPLPHPIDETYRYRIECTENMRLCTPAGTKAIRNGAGELVYTVKQEGRTVCVTRSLKLNKELYTPSEYDDLRRLLAEWCDTNGKTLLFSVR